ncbi:hypothetical protein D918_04551 [Trichuris suis]|nr:hypothetical protein D918_04551 [Trichuris suis]
MHYKHPDLLGVTANRQRPSTDGVHSNFQISVLDSQVEEKAAQLEKETSMLNFELGMLYRRQSRERELLKTENERLHKQVNELIDRLEKAATHRSPTCVCGRRRRISARSLSASARHSSSERASISPMSKSEYANRVH